MSAGPFIEWRLAARYLRAQTDNRFLSFISLVGAVGVALGVAVLLIVAVATFSIVANLVMVVRAKRTDIAILRTLGLAPRGIVGIFLSEGVVIGWSGALAGVGLGLLIATHVEGIVQVLERTFRFQILDADVYYVTRIPSLVEAGDVAAVALVALVLTLAATLYPARRAAGTEPAEALRYE